METAREKFLSCLRHQFPQEQSADEMKHLLGTIKRRQNKKNELHNELGRVNYGACSSSNERITQEETNQEEEQEEDTLYVTHFGIMSRKSPKVELRYGPRKSE